MDVFFEDRVGSHSDDEKWHDEDLPKASILPEWAKPKTQQNDFLQTTKSLIAKGGQIPCDVISATQLLSLSQRHDHFVSSINFLPFSEHVVTTGRDGCIKLSSLEDPTVDRLAVTTCLDSSIRFDFPITSSYLFPSGDGILVSGSLCYTFDFNTQQSILLPKQRRNVVGSLNGQMLAFFDEKGISIVDSKSKLVIKNLNMPSGSCADVTWNSNNEITALGPEGSICVFDVGEGKCLKRFRDATSFKCTKIDYNGLLATGSDSGIVNVYQNSNLLYEAQNLTTKITKLKFNHDGQLLAMSSNQKKTHLRLIHTGSGRVYENFPVSGLGFIESLAFSPKSGYFACGNNYGKTFIFKFNHFSY